MDFEDFFKKHFGEDSKELRDVAKKRIIGALYFLNSQRHQILGVDQVESESAYRLSFIIKKPGNNGGGGNQGGNPEVTVPIKPVLLSLELD